MLLAYSHHMRITKILMQPVFKDVMATKLYSNANVILDFVVILVIDLLVAKSSNLSVYTICFCSKQQKLYYQIVTRKCFQIALHTRLMMKILQTFERYHQINNRNEEKLTRKQIQAHTREYTQEFILFGFQRISMGIRQKIFSLMNVENTKWCNSILTSHNAQIPIHPNCSLIQIQSCLSIQKLGLYKVWGCIQLIQREVFSSLTTTPQATSKRSLTLTFCHTTSE